MIFSCRKRSFEHKRTSTKMTKSKEMTADQRHCFNPLLRDIVSSRHAMAKLADTIGRKRFEDGLQDNFCSAHGRLSCPVCLGYVVNRYVLYYTNIRKGIWEMANAGRLNSRCPSFGFMILASRFI